MNSSELAPRNAVLAKLESIQNLQSLIWDHPVPSVMHDYKMTPGMLVELSCQKCLSSDHIMWWVDKLNEGITDCHYIYINFIGDIERYVAQKFDSTMPPKQLCFIANVGRRASKPWLR